ncbi:hypothetical protein AK830_g9689 [Neonectria ditissima]|uniref:Uncharacterized protein n=1 Tax=Neonectria ditissima TaxID=78410 RepID=A0A0P7AU61_9HYPO|nr:hypothetical protein AK830_g9689 [Neonectria ditissima]
MAGPRWMHCLHPLYDIKAAHFPLVSTLTFKHLLNSSSPAQSTFRRLLTQPPQTHFCLAICSIKCVFTRKRANKPTQPPSLPPTSSPQAINKMAALGWVLPIELIRHIGLLLAPKEPYDEDQGDPDFKNYTETKRTLTSLTYTCRSTKILLEPLLYRYMYIHDAAEVTHVFLLLAQNPRLRSYIHHLDCYTALAWVPNHVFPKRDPRHLALSMWQARCGLETTPKAVLDLAGLGLDYEALSDMPIDYPVNKLFTLDDSVNFMFGCVLILAQGAKKVSFYSSIIRDEGEEAYIFSGVLAEAVKQGHQVMPNLRAMTFGTEAEPVSETVDMFFPTNFPWTNLRTLVLNDVDFDDDFLQMLAEGLFNSPMAIEELYVRGHKLFGPEADKIGEIDDIGDIQFPPVMEMLGLNYGCRPKFRAFRNLRLLDVDFPPSEYRAENSSPALPFFLSGLGSLPETIRLKCHPFPTGLIKPGKKSRLKALIVDECYGMQEVPTAQEIASAASKLRDDGGGVAPELDWVQVNGVRMNFGG